MIIRAFLLIFFVTFVFVITAFLNPIPVRQIRTDYRPLYGVSYSFEQAGWYGHNPREDYVEMLEEFEFDWVRLPFFWNQMVDPATGEFNQNFENIIYWQVENEPLIGNVYKWKIDPFFVAKEVDAVRQSDPKRRPIILNNAATGFYDTSWKKLLPILKEGDVFAVNAFFKTKGTDFITAKFLGREIHVLWPDHFVWPVQSWFVFSPDFSKIKEAVEANGNDLWVLEMQSEQYIK